MPTNQRYHTWIRQIRAMQPSQRITAYNGIEFDKHQKISKLPGLDFFFAHPYASWERGTNENTNGLICQYFSKTCDLSTVKAQEECFAMNRLNVCLRKCLDFRTPYEAFFND